MIQQLHRKIVLAASLVLALVWAILHLQRGPADDTDWVVRLTLGVLLAFGLLFGRPSVGRRARPGLLDRHPLWIPLLAAGAAVLSVIGVIVPIRQFEWLGLVLLLYSATRWAMPTEYRWNILRAFFLFYWVHPLPAQIFGPFEMWMQRLSVMGSERVLHAFNYRIWADGFILRLGAAEFGVPEACSGMRTAVTVLMCTLGVGMLFKMRWYETLVFLVAGTVQVLALNILRIVVIVHLATHASVKISETVLHDTAGIFLLVSIALVQLEMVWWHTSSRKRRALARAIRHGDAEPPKQSSFLPPAWRLVSRYAIKTILVLVLAGVVGVGVYKGRASHRFTMRKGVIEPLLHSHPQTAERAIVALQSVKPNDRELGTFLLQALVGSAKYEQALHVAENLPPPLNHTERVMKSAALADLGRLDEAAAILQRLPPDIQRLPLAALLRAQFAARVDDSPAAGEFIRYAVHSPVTMLLLRELYPYLASRGQWSAIADTHHSVPYVEVAHALISIHAHLTVSRPEIAGRILSQAVEKWPRESRLLSYLAQFATRLPDSVWEARYEESLRNNLDELDADRLAVLIDAGFGMRRPDLAWLSWRRLETLDADDPALFLAAARHAADWFVFRRRQVGMSAISAQQTVNMRDTYLERRHEPGFKPHWDNVPLAEEMTTVPADLLRERYLLRTLEELEKRERAGELTQRMHRTYPVLLGMLGRTDEAHERLDLLASIYPELNAETMMQHALNHERKAQWQAAYEALRGYFQEVDFPELNSRLMFVNTTLNIGLGHMAMQTAIETVAAFPEAPEAKMALAAAWAAFGFTEQALFVLSGLPQAANIPIYPQLLFDAGRFHEARRLARVAGVTLREERALARRPRVVPAEMTVRRHRVPALTAEPTVAAATAERLAQESDSPFVAALKRLESAWITESGQGSSADIERWRAAGRDRLESAAALYNLAVLTLQAGDDARALAAVEQGLEQSPDNLALLRLRVALSGGDPEVVAAAYARYPGDPEFWLAQLVVRIEPAAGAEPDEALRRWVRRQIQQAVDEKRYASAEMVRAADYLLRRGMPETAAIAARHAIAQGQGLETGYVVGLRSALTLKDIRWALSCALGGADHALDPKPFYQMLVNLNFAQGTMDRDMLVALNYLKEQFPDEPFWTEQLSYIHFKQGDPARALNLLMPILRRDDLREVQVRTLVLAAEAARVEGRSRHAVSILESALNVHPDNPILLNNLVYALAQDRSTLERAVQRLPQLARLAGDRPEIMDTIAVVYLKNGQFERAEYFLEKALHKIDQSVYSYPLVKATQAELLAARGDFEAGLKLLQTLMSGENVAPTIRHELQRRLDVMRRSAIDARIGQAREFVRQNDSRSAIEILQQLANNVNASEAQIREVRGLLDQLNR